MKLLYVIEGISKKGGLERILIEKLNYLAENTAHEVVLMTLWHGEDKACFDIDKRISIISLDVKKSSLPGAYILSLPLVLTRFNKVIKIISPDVTIFFRAMGAFLIWQTSWKGKKIYESHLSLGAMNHKWLYPRMERKVDVVVCLTKGDSLNFKRAKRVEVIPNFTNMKCCSDESLLHDSDKRCIAIGRLSFEKNFSRMIDLWQHIYSIHPDWCLDIYGEGEERVYLEEKIKEAKLDSSVFLKGFSENIDCAYRSHDILLMTSRCEGLPMALIEAMAHGLPCIAFDCPHGPADIITNGESGYLIPYTNDQLFINHLSSLIANDYLRHAMSIAAKTSSQKYLPAPIMQQWQELFSSLT